MPISISKLPEVTNVKDNSFMLITQDGTTKRTMCDQFVTEEEARLDEFSPTVIVGKSMSKTGEGDNVDYSSSVYDAPMKDVILKGKTMVNCIQEPSSQDVVLPYEFEDGQYVTINDTKESGTLGVELKGQTLVNSVLFIDKTLPYTWVSNNISSRTCSLRGNFKTGTYALIVDFGEVLLGGVQSSQGVSCSIQVNYTNGTLDAYMRNGLENYSNKRLFTPFNINNEVSTIEFKGVSEQYENATTEGYIPPTVTVNKIMIIEYQEGMENWDIPYFTGMTSCKMPILHTVGKNLFDGKWIENSGNSTSLYSNPIKVIPNRYYKINLNTTEHIKGITVYFYDINGNVINYQNRVIGLSPNESVYMKWYITRFSDMTKDYLQTITQIEEIQNESSTSTSYEPYKSSILSLPEEVVLRGIGDVKDTLNLTTGEYVQRIGSITANELEASDYYKSDLELENTIQFGMLTRGREKLRAKTSAKSVCNIIPVMLGNDDVFHARVDGGTPYGSFTIWMDKTKLETEDVFGLIKWLRDNNAIIQYELAEPIVTKINLPSTLKSWNTTTHIYSEIPENTLYPTLSHSNPTYPVILKPSTKYSIVANSYSNDHTNSAINFNLGGATASTTVGNRVTTITTPSTLSNELLTMSGRGNKLNNVMVIEGDVAGDEPYFEGMCDSKSPILSNVGKNLFNMKKLINTGVASHSITGESAFTVSNTQANDWQNVRFNIGTLTKGTYVLTFDYNVKSGSHNVALRHGSHGDAMYDMRANRNIIRLTRDYNDCYLQFFSSGTNKETGEVTYSNVMLTKWDGDYEPYKSNTITFNQKDNKTIVLRSLPKGVCDTLNIETGEYVQRIGEVVLCGNNGENWSVDTRKNNRIGFVTRATYGQKVASGDKAIISDKLVTVSDSDVKYSMDYTIAIGNIANYPIVITVPFNAIDESLNTEQNNTVSINSFKTWLSQNPVTVQYELATPIVSTIDVQGFPYAYKDGHVQLSSGSIEQSLTPKVEYNIATNRGGQITQNTKSLIRQGKLLDDIEDKINQIIEATINNSIMLMKLRNK